MLAACTSSGGRAISDSFSTCISSDLQAYNLDTLGYDTAKLEAKLRALDIWLWSDCEGNDQVESTLPVDCIKASRSCLKPVLNDPHLFASGSTLSVEERTLDLSSRSLQLESFSPAASSTAVPRLDLASLQPKSAPRAREVPRSLDDQALQQGGAMNTRAKKMQENMNHRSQQMQTDWTKGSKQLQAWLAKNNFFGVNAKRSGLFSSTYPLHVAAANNEADVIKLLLLRDANPHQVDSAGRTPLQVAAKKTRNGSHHAAVQQLTTVAA